MQQRGHLPLFHTLEEKTGEDSSGNNVLGHSKDKIGGRVFLKEVTVE